MKIKGMYQPVAGGVLHMVCWLERIEAEHRAPDWCPSPTGEHHCIPIRRWWLRRWICMRCDRMFRVDTR